MPHIEKTFKHLWLVDDKGHKHNVAELLMQLVPAKKSTKASNGTDTNSESDGAAGDSQGVQEAGAEGGEEADPQGGQGGGKSDGGGSKKKSASRKNKAAKKASKGKNAKS